MEKIICSLEEWDSIINYYRPNGSSKTWYLNELNELNRPLMWGMWNLFSEDGKLFDVGIFKSLVTTEYSKKIQYVPYDQIDSYKHIYIINVWNLHFFTENFDIGFKCISQKYIDDIKTGRCKILMVYQYEGYSGSVDNYDFDIIEKWRKDMDFPVDSIYLICANLLCKEIVENKGYGFQARPTHSFETWNKYDSTEVIDFKPIDNKYLFLSYNRNPRPQRYVLLSHFLEYNLFNKGQISFNKGLGPIPDYINKEYIDFLLTNAPFIIDERYDLNYNLAVNITKEDYEHTFISVISESLVNEGTLFFSEKIWKPLMVGHPFILFGNQHSLRYLKNLGFKTFNHWFDESYDDEPNSDKRSLMIANILKQFDEMPLDKLKTIRDEMKSVCEHNQKMFKHYYENKYGENNINKEISNVIDEIWESLEIKLI